MRLDGPGWQLRLDPPAGASGGLSGLWARLGEAQGDILRGALLARWEKELEKAFVLSDPQPGARWALPDVAERLRDRAAEALGEALRGAFKDDAAGAAEALGGMGVEPYPEYEWFEVPSLQDGAAAAAVVFAPEGAERGASEPVGDVQTFATADGMMFRVVGRGPAVRGALGVRCRVVRRGIAWGKGAGRVVIAPCEVVAYGEAAIGELDATIDRIARSLPTLAGRIHEAAGAASAVPEKLARVAGVLRQALLDRSLRAPLPGQGMKALRDYAEGAGWEILYGHAGLGRALQAGYDDFAAALEDPDAATAEDPGVELVDHGDLIFVVARDGQAAVWPAPVRIVVRSRLGAFVRSEAPDLAAPLAKVLVRFVLADEAGARDRAREGVRGILLELRGRLWASAPGEAQDAGRRFAARIAFREACSRWIDCECLDVYEVARGRFWEVETTRGFAVDGTPAEEVVLPAMVPRRPGEEVYPGRVRIRRQPPEWLAALGALSGEWPWGKAAAATWPEDVGRMGGPFRAHFEALLREPVEVAAARRAVDAVLDEVDGRLTEGTLGRAEADRARAFRERLLEWANGRLCEGMPAPEELIGRKGAGSCEFLKTPLPGAAAPRAFRYARFAPRTIEICCGEGWIEADRPQVARRLRQLEPEAAFLVTDALIRQEVASLPDETLSELARLLDRLEGQERAELAEALHFEARPPWFRRCEGGWTWHELAAGVEELYALPGGEKATRERILSGGIALARGDSPVPGPRCALVHDGGGKVYVSRGEWRGVAWPLPRRIEDKTDLLGRMDAALDELRKGGENAECRKQSCASARYLRVYEGFRRSFGAKVEGLAAELAAGRLGLRDYVTSVFRSYWSLTDGLPAPEPCADFVAEVRRAAADYLGARLVPRLGPASSSAEVLSWGAPVELCDRPAGEAARAAHPFGGIRLAEDEQEYYQEEVVYAVGRELLSAVGGAGSGSDAFRAEAKAALDALVRQDDPSPLALLFLRLREAGCPAEAVGRAAADLGFHEVLTQPVAEEVREAPEGCEVVWAYDERPPRRVIGLDRGLRYGSRIIRRPRLSLSRGPAPLHVAGLAAREDVWPDDALKWRDELRAALQRCGEPTSDVDARLDVAAALLRLTDEEWRTGAQKDARVARLTRDLADAARRDGLLDAVLPGDLESHRLVEEAPADAVAWKKARSEPSCGALRFEQVQFAVVSPPSLARPAVYVPVLPDDAFGGAVAELLRRGMYKDCLAPLMRSAPGARLDALGGLVAQGPGDLPPTLLAELAGALGAALEPRTLVSEAPPATISREEFEELRPLGQVRVRYLPEEAGEEVFRISEVRRYGLRVEKRWVLDPWLTLETSSLPEWARIARACEALIQDTDDLQEFRGVWRGLLEGSPSESGGALERVLECASRAYRKELLLGEPERGKPIYDRLLSAQDYERRYAAFSAALEKTGIPVEKMLYRSQLARRLVHLDPRAPSGDMPVLWGVEPSPSGTGVALRFALAVRSR